MQTMPAGSGTRPDVLKGSYQDKAYGVSFLPWDSRIQLEPPTVELSSSPRFKGFIPITDHLVPVFDLRAESAGDTDNPDAKACLLVVAMSSNATGPIELGLLLSGTQGKFNIPPDAILNLARRN